MGLWEGAVSLDLEVLGGSGHYLFLMRVVVGISVIGGTCCPVYASVCLQAVPPAALCPYALVRWSTLGRWPFLSLGPGGVMQDLILAESY